MTYCLEHIAQALAAGATWRMVGEVYGADHSCVRKWFLAQVDPEFREQQRRRAREIQRERRAAGRASRAGQQRWREHWRREARKQAAESGEPVEAIYQRWGCA